VCLGACGVSKHFEILRSEFGVGYYRALSFGDRSMFNDE
jgi:polyisoprenoid-binding protein YceI